jgi:hypothetical protein
MHNLIIWFLIIIIVAVQAYVFKITLDKIKIYKNILPDQDNFKTVKVLIKESEIETISLVSIFKNLKNYSQNREKKSTTIKYDNELVNQIEIQPKIDLNEEEYDISNEKIDDNEILYKNENQMNDKNNEIQFP